MVEMVIRESLFAYVKPAQPQAKKQTTSFSASATAKRPLVISILGVLPAFPHCTNVIERTHRRDFSQPHSAIVNRIVHPSGLVLIHHVQPARILRRQQSFFLNSSSFSVFSQPHSPSSTVHSVKLVFILYVQPTTIFRHGSTRPPRI